MTSLLLVGAAAVADAEMNTFAFSYERLAIAR